MDRANGVRFLLNPKALYCLRGRVGRLLIHRRARVEGERRLLLHFQREVMSTVVDLQMKRSSRAASRHITQLSCSLAIRTSPRIYRLSKQTLVRLRGTGRDALGPPPAPARGGTLARVVRGSEAAHPAPAAAAAPPSTIMQGQPRAAVVLNVNKRSTRRRRRARADDAMAHHHPADHGDHLEKGQRHERR